MGITLHTVKESCEVRSAPALQISVGRRQSPTSIVFSWPAPGVLNAPAARQQRHLHGYPHLSDIVRTSVPPLVHFESPGRLSAGAGEERLSLSRKLAFQQGPVTRRSCETTSTRARAGITARHQLP